MKTNQEIFDKVSSHLLKQNAKSIRKGICAFRGEDGLTCAIGCLIADSDYGPEMEGRGPMSAELETPLKRSGIDLSLKSSSIDLLVMLQQVHDLRSPKAWPRELSKVAARYNLTTS